MSVGSQEVFSLNVEASIFADVNDHIELIFSVGSKEVFFGLVNEPDVPSVLVKGRVGSSDFVESEVGELGQDVSVGISKGFV